MNNATQFFIETLKGVTVAATSKKDKIKDTRDLLNEK